MNGIYFSTQHFFLMIRSVTVRSEPEPVNMIQKNFILRGVMWFPIMHIAIFFFFYTVVGMEQFIRKCSWVRKGVSLTCNRSVRAHENTYFKTVQNVGESRISVVAPEW